MLEVAISRSATADLPAVFAALVPELAEQLWVPEARADCADCVMTPKRSGADPLREWAFVPDVRCCSFNPRISNFSLGRVLRQRGPGAMQVMRRLQDLTEVTAWGIGPQPAWQRAYAQVETRRFGKNRELRCPYWVGGEHACGVWSDRPAVCRTWFCKHDQGEQGRSDWGALRTAIELLERRLGMFLVGLSATPEVGASAGRWASWYVWCADRIERLTPKERDVLRDEVLESVRAQLRARHERVHPELPEVLIAEVHGMSHSKGFVRLFGYSIYDGAHLPHAVFEFLSRLDGQRPWRVALAEAAAVLDEPITEQDVHELVRCGVLRSPLPTDHPFDEPTSVLDLYPELAHHPEALASLSRPGEEPS